MITYLDAHRALAVTVVVLGCLIVGAIELIATNSRKVASLTWFFGLLVVAVYVFGSVKSSTTGMLLAGVIVGAGTIGLVMFARDE